MPRGLSQSPPRSRRVYDFSTLAEKIKDENRKVPKTLFNLSGSDQSEEETSFTSGSKRRSTSSLFSSLAKTRRKSRQLEEQNKKAKVATPIFKRPAAVARKKTHTYSASSRTASSSELDTRSSSRVKSARNVQKRDGVKPNDAFRVDSSAEVSQPLVEEVSKKEEEQEMAEDAFTEDSSEFSTLHDSVVSCLTRDRSRLNMSLHQSFISLGPIKLESSMTMLPKWIANVYKERSQAPSQILAKVEYKVAKKEVPDSKSVTLKSAADTKLMPPPSLPSQSTSRAKNHDSKIRIQQGKGNIRELRAWCFKINEKGSIHLQGFDMEKEIRIVSGEILSVKNQRTVATARNTYQLVGQMETAKLKHQKLPPSIALQFKQGFPENWREVITNATQKLSDTLVTVQDEDVSAINFSDNEPEQEQSDLKEESGESQPRSTPRWSGIVKNKLEKNDLKSEKVTKSQGASATSSSSDLGCTDTSVDSPILVKGSKIIYLHDWQLVAIGKNSNFSYQLSGLQTTKAGTPKSREFFHLEDWTLSKPRTLVLTEGDSEIELVGPPWFPPNKVHPNKVKYLTEKFKNGIPRDYKSVLNKGDEYESSSSISPVGRSVRKKHPPMKYWEGEKITNIGGKTMVRKRDLDDWKNLSQKSQKPEIPKPAKSKPVVKKERRRVVKSDLASSSSDEEDFVKNVKPHSTTMKAAKKKAEYKAKHKEKATFADNDFFDYPDFLKSSDEEFDIMLRSPVVEIRNAAKHNLSPMAAFVSSSQLNESNLSSDDDDAASVVHDKRKKKTFEKFVYHESNKKDKRPAPVVKKPAASSKIMKSDLALMKDFLDKNLNRKKEFDRQVTLGEVSDGSDFD